MAWCTSQWSQLPVEQTMREEEGGRMGCGREHRMPFIFYLCKCWIYFLFIFKSWVCGGLRIWGETGTLRLHLWGVFKVPKPPSRDWDLSLLLFVLIPWGVVVQWGELLFCKSIVRHCPSLPGSDVLFGEVFRIQAVQDFAFKVLCLSEMPETITRLHLPVNCFAKWPLISWPRGPAHSLSVLHKILVVFLFGQSTGLWLGLRSGRVNLEKPGQRILSICSINRNIWLLLPSIFNI